MEPASTSLPRLDLGLAQYWKVSGVREAAAFFRSLQHLMQPGGILYLEDGAHPQQFRHFLTQRACAPTMDVPFSTVWPRPYTVHLPVTNALLLSLADQAQHMAEPQVCIHAHGYHGNRVVFVWFDAFFDPLMINIDVPEPAVASFCGELGASYARVQGDV
jgi:hypothetical protein